MILKAHRVNGVQSSCLYRAIGNSITFLQLV